MNYLITRHQCCVIFFFCGAQILCISVSKAQDLSAIDRKNPFRVSGGFNITQTVYNSWELANRRDPYYWMINANLSFELFGISIPFSATLSQQSKSFTQPFNVTGISPRYKAITVHLGYRSMPLSVYTLAGTIFLGGGVEVSPSNSPIRFSAMYGRFSKAVSVQAAEGVVSGQPAFERWGYGSKISLGKQGRTLDLIMFHASDNYVSLPVSVIDSFKLKPAENLVLGINTRLPISKSISADLEYSFSAYTQDIRIEESELKKYTLVNNLGPFFTANISSQFNKAISANLSYTDKLFQFRISYRRIDPEFKTMGSAFLNNDLEDISGNLAWQMLKNKINIAIGMGVQKNNLDKTLMSGMNRFLGSLNLTYMINKKVNISGSYSNFSSSTKINNNRVSANQLGLTQNMDSLAYNQITNSANAGINYNTGNQQIKHILFSNAAYQKANDNHGNTSSYYNLNSGYQLVLTPIGLNISASACMNTSIIRETGTRSFGPNLSISKQLFKNIVRSSFNLSHLKTNNNGSLSGSNTILRFLNFLKAGKHHNISMDISYLNRSGKNGTRSFSEIRASLIYGFTF